MSVTNPEFNPSGDERIDYIKKRGSELGLYIELNIEDGRRKSVALTQLETALMWAVKAAAVGDKE